MSPSELLEEAVAAVRSGRVVGTPTDTVYGLAVDPFDEAAVVRLHELKGRPEGKPFALLVGSVGAVGGVARLDGRTRRLADRYWPGPLTIVLPALMTLPPWIGDTSRRTVGVRMPDHRVSLALLSAAGPLVVSSANRSGEAPALDSVEAKETFGDEVAVYLPGRCPGGVASTVVDATGGRLRLVRSGPLDVEIESSS